MAGRSNTARTMLCSQLRNGNPLPLHFWSDWRHFGVLERDNFISSPGRNGFQGSESRANSILPGLLCPRNSLWCYNAIRLSTDLSSVGRASDCNGYLITPSGCRLFEPGRPDYCMGILISFISFSSGCRAAERHSILSGFLFIFISEHGANSNWNDVKFHKQQLGTHNKAVNTA